VSSTLALGRYRMGHSFATRMVFNMSADSEALRATRSRAPQPGSANQRTAAFTEFVSNEGLRLRKVLTARYGVETGGDIYAETLAWAWQNWDKLDDMQNPVGYLYRVAQSSARPHRRWMRRNAFPANIPERWHLDEDPSLFDSLRSLPDAQRVAVLMVHGHKWTYSEVAEVLDCSVAAVTNHVHRGLAALRQLLEAEEL
jgi:RNA polymerase sigma factor (sigma-70 family)